MLPEAEDVYSEERTRLEQIDTPPDPEKGRESPGLWESTNETSSGGEPRGPPEGQIQLGGHLVPWPPFLVFAPEEVEQAHGKIESLFS